VRPYPAPNILHQVTAVASRREKNAKPGEPAPIDRVGQPVSTGIRGNHFGGRPQSRSPES